MHIRIRFLSNVPFTTLFMIGCEIVNKNIVTMKLDMDIPQCVNYLHDSINQGSVISVINDNYRNKASSYMVVVTHVVSHGHSIRICSQKHPCDKTSPDRSVVVGQWHYYLELEQTNFFL